MAQPAADSDAAAECADALARRTIEELCEEWATATDADAVGELADELAKRALDVRDPEDVARLCSAIVARLNGSKDDDDEIAAVLDAVTCGGPQARAATHFDGRLWSSREA